MVTTEACIHVADVHDRNAGSSEREDWGDWLETHLVELPNPDKIISCGSPGDGEGRLRT